MRYILLAAAAAFVFVLSGSVSAGAAVHTRTVEYTHDGATLKGFLAYGDPARGKRPGVMVVHEWWGLNEYPKRKAMELAAMGYVAFAVDMYGDGRTTVEPKEAERLASRFREDRDLMRARARAGLEVLKRHPLVDAGRVAAIGFCFGGGTVLELARSGADLKGVVSFHGSPLDTPRPEKTRDVKARVLVLHGGSDPFVKPAQVESFAEEMTEAGVDWQMITYGGVVHAFTNPAVGNDPSTGAAYSKKAAERSWLAMTTFLIDIFGR